MAQQSHDGERAGRGGQTRAPEQVPADPDRGDYGGAASGEGQGEYGGDGYSNQGQFTDQRAPQYPDQGYGHDYGEQRIGWQQGYEEDDEVAGSQGDKVTG